MIKLKRHSSSTSSEDDNPKNFQLSQRYRNKNLTVEQRYGIILSEVKNYIKSSNIIDTSTSTAKKHLTSKKRNLSSDNVQSSSIVYHLSNVAEKKITSSSLKKLIEKGFSAEFVAGIVLGNELVTTKALEITDDDEKLVEVKSLIKKYRKNM